MNSELVNLLKRKDYFYENYLSSFSSNGFQEKKNTTIDILNANAKTEFIFLERIRKAADSLNIKFYPTNWPKGFRSESYFYTYFPYKFLDNGMEIHNTFWIEIGQSTKRCRVSFRFPPMFRPEVPLAEALDKINKPIDENILLYSDLQMLKRFKQRGLVDLNEVPEINIESIEATDLLFNDIDVLAQTSFDELGQIGLEFGSRDNHLCALIKGELNKKTQINIEDIVRVLELKYEFNKLFAVNSEECSIAEGIVLFEANFSPKSPAVYRDIQKETLRIRLCNKTKNVILINNSNKKELTISQLLNLFGVNHNISDEVKALLDFSTSDLNIISMLLEQVG